MTFKVGDLVKVVPQPHAINDRIWEMHGPKSDPRGLYFVQEVNTDLNRQANTVRIAGSPIWWHAGRFAHAEKKPAPKQRPSVYIVLRRQGNQLSGAVCPTQHTSRRAAKLESQRLAAKHPGNDFYVMEAIMVSRSESTPVHTELLSIAHE